MPEIRILPETLAHQIAAGEIVERPASVVKELLENALDAKATRIVIQAEEAGKRSLLVRDDGIGMNPDDARLAFQHHATSKIRSFEDLSQIQTLGFRGEALPSIASISRLRLRTVGRAEAQAEGALGTEIEYQGGTLKEVNEVAWPQGTEVLVEDLFFNVPARRKFLKTDATELGHLTRQITQYALAYPEVEFRFIHRQRAVFEAPAAASLEDRIYQIQGEAFLENLVPLEYEKSGVHVSGVTSLPHEHRSNAASQFLFVNRRMVRDRVLAHAIRMAYQNIIPAKSYPTVVLFVRVDPQQIDVNVHPAKTEIRFHDSSAVHSAVHHAIEEALSRQNEHLFHRSQQIPAHGEHALDSIASGNGVSPSIANYFDRHSRSGTPLPGLQHSSPIPLYDGVVSDISENGSTLASTETSACQAHSEDIPVTDYFSPLPVALGQFVESFVVAVDREGVILVDQHVAHERILYDRALTAMESPQTCSTQRLLVPVTCDLNVQQKAVLEDILDQFNDNGFEVEWFGTQSIVIKGVPAFAKGCDADLLIQEILEGWDPTHRKLEDRDALGKRLREKIAISLSCRAAIKINTSLSQEKMQWLLDELFRSQNPFTCPHGRPIILRLAIEEILQGFKRI